jgi:predicted peroxiredoxin
MAATLVVKITRALDDPERAHLGWNVAATALVSGVEVHVVLAADGVHLARPEVPADLHLADAPPVGELIDAVYEAGTVTVCAPCATRRGLGAGDFRPGTELAGAARFVELVTAEGATGLVY